MPHFSERFTQARGSFFAFLLTLILTAHAWAASTTVVITQIYGAGGNSGAVLDSDFVELFNLSPAPVSLNGWSIQYISSAGVAATSGTSYNLPNVTLAPGQYFMMKGRDGDDLHRHVHTRLPNVHGRRHQRDQSLGHDRQDFSGEQHDAADGRVAHRHFGSLHLHAPHRRRRLRRIRHLGHLRGRRQVHHAERDGGPGDYSDQSLHRHGQQRRGLYEWHARPPHSSATTFAPCSTSTPTGPSVTATVTPSSQTSGLAVLLKGTVQPGYRSRVPTWSVAATVDLSGLGGSTTQPLYDDGTHGDATAGDSIYSYTLNIPAGQAPSVYKINFAVSDSQLRSGTTSANLTVTAPVSFVPIHTIQGSMGTGATAPTASSYVGQVVQTSGIVTGVLANGYYLQARDSAADSDPTTPEGIFVHAGSGAVPATATVGSEVQVSGTVSLYPSGATLAGTELDSVTGYSVLSTGNVLPAAIPLTTSFPESRLAARTN